LVAGSSIYAITKDWNRLGLLTPRVNRWRGTQVRHVLLAPRNAGLRVLRGRVIRTGNWPAIVPEDIWRGVVDILADPKRHTRRSRARKHPLSGLALCGVCGNRLGSSVNSHGGLIYLCKGCNKVSPRRRQTGRARCRGGRGAAVRSRHPFGTRCRSPSTEKRNAVAEGKAAKRGM
jgi:Recombinase